MSDAASAPQLFDLTGRLTPVTGAGSGIGRALALGMAQCGAAVACLDRRSDGGLAQTLVLLAATDRPALAVTGDVSDPEALARAVAETEGALGL